MAQGLVKTSTSLSTSSECLTRCKWDNYELAMIVVGKNKTFNCTCIQRDFYKFTMQDFSSYCTDVSTYVMVIQVVEFSSVGYRINILKRNY